MMQITAREANQRFSQILALVEAGEQVVVTKHGRAVMVMTPYRPPALTKERQAAIDHAIAVMDEPVEIEGEFRTFTREEMHER